MKKFAYSLIAALSLLCACTSSSSEETPSTVEQNAPDTSVDNNETTSSPEPEQAEKKDDEMVTVSRSTGLGDTLTYYAVNHGDNAGDATFGSFMNGFLLPMFVDERAVEVRLAFESTTNPRRTEEEAFRMIKDYIPVDAKKIGDFEGGGIKGEEYESATLANALADMYKTESSITEEKETPGTFHIYVKFDAEGVYSAVARVGKWK
ncbi:hypothetical protein [Brevibacillus agri]|uniref:hypothetical protein n=1 Tax=Brevibacillus agri TaxID=51101 RepID=UPI001EE55B6B|nr:hypothetical protein [Brevibacillus agri]MCG5252627.1 hypothetical protein [Brevibacillus agri]